MLKIFKNTLFTITLVVFNFLTVPLTFSDDFSVHDYLWYRMNEWYEGKIWQIQREVTSNALEYYEFDSNGRKVRETSFAKGKDEKYLTDDDSIDSYFVYDYDSNGDKTAFIMYNSPGHDNIWYNSDDQIKYYRKYSYDNKHREVLQVIYTGPGKDNIWLTFDDDVDVYYTTEYNNNQGIFSQIINGPGPDNRWFTEDDKKFSQEYEAIIKINPDTQINFVSTSPGPDGKWLTGDDTLKENRYEKIRYDIYKNPVEGKSCWNPGEDELWFTGDDVCPDTVFQTFQYINGQYRMVKQVWELSLFFLDVPEKNIRYTIIDYDFKGYPVKMIFYENPGPDNVWYTSDDLPSGYYAIKEGSNREIYNIFFSDAGPDGVWFDSDDKILTYEKYRISKYGIVEKIDNFTEAGPDGVWFTDDDFLEYFTYFEFKEFLK